MSNNEIIVDFTDNQILINSVEFPINDFKYFVKNNNDYDIIERINDENNKNDFIEAQRRLRVLDMMKDGGVSGGNNISGSVIKIAYVSYFKEETTIPNDLLKIEEKFFDSAKEKIEKFEWTKISNSKTKKINIDFCFQESGLNSSYFIDDNLEYCTNFANEVLDPALRKSNTNSINFPEINEKIKFTKKFLNFFGFINSVVESKKINENPKYEFKININDFEITNRIKIIEKKEIDFFGGNIKKNNLINDKLIEINNKKKSKNKEENLLVCNALLVCKEMGDVLQVLFMLIWKNLNPGKTYCISTCDKVVALFCIMLNLNYTLSNAKYVEYYNYDENKNINIKDKNKIKFNKEKELIIKNNKEIIKSIEILKNKNNEPTPISFSVSGYSDIFVFPTIFYENIFADYITIQRQLLKFKLKLDNPSDLEDSSIIKNKIIDMKKNFTLIRLIIKNKDNTYKLCFNKKYTLKNNLYSLKSNFNNYGSKSFFEIGKMITGGKTDNNKMEVVNDNESDIDNNKMEVVNDNESDIDNNKMELNDDNEIGNEIYNEIIDEIKNENENEILKILEFCEEEANFYDKDNENTYNLYDLLKKNIDFFLFRLRFFHQFFDDFYNILLYYFYFENEVFYGNELENLIQTIANEILDKKKIQEIIQEIINKNIKLMENKNAENTNLQNIKKRTFEELANLPKPQNSILTEQIHKNKTLKTETGGFKKNKTNKKLGLFMAKTKKYNKKKQIKKKNKQTKKKNKQTKKKNKI